MLTDTSRWSHTRGNDVVPCSWQATKSTKEASTVTSTTSSTATKSRRFSPRTKQRSGRYGRKNGWAYLFVAPQIIGLVLFTVLPTGASVLLSFTDWTLGSGGSWVGPQNYTRALADPDLITAARNTLVFTVMYVPAVVIVAMSVALLLMRVRKGRALYETAYFMPLVTSTAATSLIWALVFQPDFGLANAALDAVSLPGLGWFSSPEQALPTMVIIVVWAAMGQAIILFTAGLNSVPAQIYEAAALDGASGIRRFISITLPMVSPTTFFIVTITIIGSLQFFVEPYIITEGGPGNATNTVVLELYNQAFTYAEAGPASAISCLLFIAILAITLVQFRFAKWVNYEN